MVEFLACFFFRSATGLAATLLSLLFVHYITIYYGVGATTITLLIVVICLLFADVAIVIGILRQSTVYVLANYISTVFDNARLPMYWYYISIISSLRSYDDYITLYYHALLLALGRYYSAVTNINVTVIYLYVIGGLILLVLLSTFVNRLMVALEDSI